MEKEFGEIRNSNTNAEMQKRYPVKEYVLSLSGDESRKKYEVLAQLYDSLLQSSQYLSLGGKTQVLNSAVSDEKLEITTRMIHDFQVSQNAMKIAFKLGLKPEDIMLAQVMGLAHDLGHTPFGHDGEVALQSEVAKFGEGFRFSHADYGADILEEIIDSFNEEKKCEVDSEKEIEYINSIREVMKCGVRQHSIYYGYRAPENETDAQKCVRLSDTLSFMVTDLSDLMRGTKDGVPIVATERVIKEIESIREKRSTPNLQYVINCLRAGGPKLAELHEQIIEEAFSTTRGENRGGKRLITTVVDDYKLLQEVRDGYEEISGKSDEEKNKSTFTSIVAYYEYLTKHSDIAVRNDEFLEIVSKQLGGKTQEENLSRLQEIVKKISDAQKINRGKNSDKNEEPNLTFEDMQIISSIVPAVKENVEKNIERIEEIQFKNCPTLMALFKIQDKIQYKEILAKIGKEDILGNQTSVTQEKVSKRFQTILKIAYAASQKAEEFCIDGKIPDLSTHDGNKVPMLGNISYLPLRYALYSVQQMKNSDFEDDKAIDRIIEELGIDKNKLHEIESTDLSEIYASAREFEVGHKTETITGKNMFFTFKKTSQNEYEYQNVKKLVTDTPEINANLHNELINKIKEYANGKEIVSKEPEKGE